MNLKKIQAMPFAPFRRESMERWRVTVKEPVVDGERMLVVDSENTACVSYKRETPSFRIVCGKKSGEVKGHHARRKGTAEGSGFLPEVHRGIRS